MKVVKVLAFIELFNFNNIWIKKDILAQCPLKDGVCDIFADICLNGGKCENNVNSENGFICKCPNLYFTGERCEKIGDKACLFINCLNNGTCINIPCPNNGSCLVDNKYTCQCNKGHTGKFCENKGK